MFDFSAQQRAALRQFKIRLGWLLLLNLLALTFAPFDISAQALRREPPALRPFHLTKADDAFLEDLSRRAFQYFWEQSELHTGLTLDRARTDGQPSDENHRYIASIAANGFGLTAYCIAAERKWKPRNELRDRVRLTLKFFATEMPHEHGWFHHFIDARSGERIWRSEVSSIDTALLLGGVLTARAYFHEDPEIVRLATAIYERVDFQWMLNGDPFLLSHGWREETGFLKNRWHDYSEQMNLLLMAIGSPTHPIPPAAWRAWQRQYISYAGYEYMSAHPPLFIHQFAHAWVDFRGRREGFYPFMNFYENSAKATRAHKEFCLSLAPEFPGYTENVWGITASDSQKGYLAWGGPPRSPQIDGTVVPCAAGGSLMFTPDIAVPTLREMKEKFGARIYGRYGFADAFNPNDGWVDSDVIGIDVGITLLSAENLRSGFVWRYYMRNREIPRALDAVGLRRGSDKQRIAIAR